ncbi:MAG: helix-turn-helix domain-containing protein [Pseudomonadota bacterium]
MANLARNTKQIGALIRRERKRRKMTQGDLGVVTGLRQETISLIENGSPSTKIETLLSVIGALDLELRVEERSKTQSSDIESIF